MPYIKQRDRLSFEKILEEVKVCCPDNAGELNYLLTSIMLIFFENSPKNYQAYNDIIGAVEGAKLELYRRHVAPYEDIKIESNGDVDVD